MFESKIELENTELPVTEAELTLFEEKHNIRFPDDYRQFLLSRTGSLVELWWFDSIDDEGYVFSAELMDLYSLTEIEELWDVHLEQCRSFQEDGGFPEPECFQCIGLAAGGDKLFMWLNKSYCGKIYLYYYELYPDFHLLANSFTEFIKMLKVPDPIADQEE